MAADRQPGEATPPQAAQQKYDDALLEAIDLLAQKKYAQALASLETAAKYKDTELVQTEIKKLRWRIEQQETADRTLRDIQGLLDQGKLAEAGQLASAALQEYGATDAVPGLVQLKRQADALAAAKMNDNAARQKAFRDQGQAAFEVGNLRAAALAFEQVLQFGDDAQLRPRRDDILGKLAKYDDDRQKAAELRKDPSNLEDAIELLNDAAKQWDTPQIRQDLDEYRLALQFRRDPLAIADFEARGDVGIPQAERAVPEELLPHFKGRFDLVERSQIAKLLEELKVEAGRLGDSDQNQREVGRLAKVRYLVLGSVTRLGGLTVNARLVDARSGLIVQTAKISAAAPEDLMAMLPELAKLLLMSDQERVAYEQELAKQAQAVQAVQIDQPLPPAPEVAAADQPLPPPEILDSNRPPDLGGAKVEDLQGFQPLGDGQPLPAIVYGGEAEELWRKKALCVSLSLGDNLFRRGRHREALRFYEFGLTLGPAFVDLDLRIGRTRPLLSAPMVVIAAPPPPRIAIVDFLVVGDPAVVPPSLGWWAPQYLAPYFSPPFEVVDRGELYWWMGRMGMTVRDLMVDPYARRWLGRALNVRYFVVGSVTQTTSFNVDTYMVDAEYGYLRGRGFVHARQPLELKWRLSELARMTQTPPGLWQQQQQGYRDYEVLVVKAQESMNRGEFAIAVGFLGDAQKLRPGSLELQFYFQQTDTLAKQRVLQEQRRKELERQEQLAAEHKRQQEKLAGEIERQRILAAKEAGALSQDQRLLLEKNRLADKVAAHNQLLLQARLAFKGRDVNLSIQLYESALALDQSDEVHRELAAARAELDRVTKQRLAEEAKLRDLQVQQQREGELAKARARLETERKQREQEEAALRKTQEDRDNAAFLRLVDQGEKHLAEAKYNAAISTFQAARQLKKTDRLDALLNQALVAQARADADAKGAAARKDLERQLAEAKTLRDKGKDDTVKPLDQLSEAQKKTEAFQKALSDGRLALQNKQFDAAIQALGQAQKLRPGDPTVASLLQQVEKGHTDAQRDATADAEKLKKKVAFNQAIKQGQDLLAAKRYDDAIKAFQLAGSYQPGDPSAISLLQQAEMARADAQRYAAASAEKMKQKVAYDQAIRQGQDLLAAKKYDDAIKAFQLAGSYQPGDAAVAGWLKKAEMARGDAAAVLQKQAEFNSLMKEGNAALGAKKYAEAVQSFTDASKLMPADANAAKALRDAHLQWAASKGPQPPTAAQVAEYTRQMQAGATFEKQKKWQEAIKAYEGALQQIPKDAKAKAAQNKATYRLHMAEGNRYLTARQFPNAVHEFEAALQLYPNDAEAVTALKKAKEAK